MDDKAKAGVNLLWFAGAIVCGLVMNLGVTQPKTFLQGLIQMGVGASAAISFAPPINQYFQIPADSSTHYSIVSIVSFFGFMIAKAGMSMAERAQQEQWLTSWVKKRYNIEAEPPKNDSEKKVG